MRALSIEDRLRVAGAVSLLAFPLVGGMLVLWQDGWGINRLNVRIWAALLTPFGLHRHITPEQFAVVMNVVLVVPVGFALYLLWHRWWWALVILAGSIGVEAYQLRIGTRDASVLDVVTNTAGGVIGILLARRLLIWVRSREDAAGSRGVSGAEPSIGAGVPPVAADQTTLPAPHVDSAGGPAAARGDHD